MYLACKRGSDGKVTDLEIYCSTVEGETERDHVDRSLGAIMDASKLIENVPTLNKIDSSETVEPSNSRNCSTGQSTDTANSPRHPNRSVTLTERPSNSTLIGWLSENGLSETETAANILVSTHPTAGMLRALIAWLKPTGKSGEESDDSAEEDESESTFLRSRLDASVLSSHGVRTANKPVQELESEAGELAEQFPDQHQQFEDPKQ